MGQGAVGSCKGCFSLDFSGRAAVENSAQSSSSSAEVPDLLVVRGFEGLAGPPIPGDAKAVVTVVSRQGTPEGHVAPMSSTAQKLGGRKRPSLKIVPTTIPVSDVFSEVSPAALTPNARKTKRLNTTGLAAEYRIRFMNFNMANSSFYNSLNELQGPGGRGLFESAMREPFSDGRAVDIFHTTLVETRLSIGDWVEEYRKRNRNHRLNALIAQNARREGAQKTGSRMRRVAERIGASYNGNLKSLLAFSTEDFEQDTQAGLFGRLTEAKIGGIPVPNPKKAFMGKVLQALPHNGCSDPGIRFCFISAHFPMARLAAAMEKAPSDDRDVLTECKICYAKTLRKILYKACNRGLIDNKTVLVVQGDLNSRTVLENGEARDVLLEVLNDENMQAALVHELPIPIGQWHEPVEFDACEELPVTYKFHEQGGGGNEGLTLGQILLDADVDEVFRTMSEPPSPPSPAPPKRRPSFFRRSQSAGLEEKKESEEKKDVRRSRSFGFEEKKTAEEQKSVEGDDAWPRRNRKSVISAADSVSSTGTKKDSVTSSAGVSIASLNNSESTSGGAVVRTVSTASKIARRTNRFSTYGNMAPYNGVYMRTMANLGEEKLEELGVAFKKESFRPYRFPSSTDRVIYWAPDSLDERLSWRFPQGGYEVNYSQLGSDHRPVALEAVLCVATSLPAPQTNGATSPPASPGNGTPTEGGKRTKRRTSKENFEAAMRENPALNKNLMEIFMEDEVDSDPEPDAEQMSESNPSRCEGSHSQHWNLTADTTEKQPQLTHTVSRGSLGTDEDGERETTARQPKATSPTRRMSAQNEGGHFFSSK